MNRASILIATAIACSIGTMSFAANAQERGYRRDASPSAKHYSDGFRRDYPRYHYAPRYWAAPHRPWRYYDPYWFYPAPVISYPYPLYEPQPLVVERVYEPQPLIVERVYEPRRFYEAEPVERPQPYRERSYAQAEPSRPAPPAPAAQPPRLERYTLSAKELFEFDKATLRKPQPRLDEIADAMKRNPQIDSVTITGYTDRLGTEAYNLALSMRRANAVKAYLVEKGVAASRLKAFGKGEANPVVECRDSPKSALIKCLEPNRRVEVESITVERPAR